MARKHTSKTPGVTYAEVRTLAKKLPGVEESTSYGTMSLKVRGKLMARLKEDGETLVLRTTMTNRDILLRTAPAVVFLSDHYRDYPWLLIRLPRIDRAFLVGLLEDAWILSAPKRLRDSRAAVAADETRPRGGEEEERLIREAP